MRIRDWSSDVCASDLIATRLSLSQYLRLGEGELKSGGFRRPSILADALEALFGAVFLDGGFDAAQKVIARQYEPVLVNVDPKTLGKDPKTLLQELLQARKLDLPLYTVVATHGAAHNQMFEVECQIPKLDIKVAAGGSSRRAAEQSARSEEHTSELQSLMRTSYAVFCLKKKPNTHTNCRQ